MGQKAFTLHFCKHIFALFNSCWFHFSFFNTIKTFPENVLGVEGATIIANSIAQNKTITSLTLNRNGIGDSGAKEFAKALLNNTTLTFLSLDGLKNV